MRLASFTSQGRDSFGIVEADTVIDMQTLDCPDLLTALTTKSLASLHEQSRRATTILSTSEIIWQPPIRRPDKILCVGYNYRAHLLETGTPVPKHPAFFVRFPGAQVGHLQPIVCPSISAMFDFEGELAVVIGRPGRHIQVETAMRYVAGYSCFADNSVRDFQRHSTQATPGKNFDASGAFGPWLVTADEIPTLGALTLVTRLNGTIVQESGLHDLIFSVPELVAYASSFTQLLPGDVIATGTPSGVGMSRTPPLWMQAGDVLDVAISGIGSLRNPVIDEEIRG